MPESLKERIRNVGIIPTPFYLESNKLKIEGYITMVDATLKVLERRLSSSTSDNQSIESALEVAEELIALFAKKVGIEQANQYADRLQQILDGKKTGLVHEQDLTATGYRGF